MKEDYIAMRLSGKLDLNIFYQFYVQEFSKYDKYFENKHKDAYGFHILKETSFPGLYIYESDMQEREMLSMQQFAAQFSLYVQVNTATILEYMDKKLEVTKVENSEGQLIYMN